MRAFHTLCAILTAIALFSGASAYALGPGSTSAAYLKLPSGARAIGMGECYVAAGDDVQAIGWNPAGIARVSGREFTFMHAEWFQGIRYESLAYAQPLMGFITVGGGVDFLNSGTIDKTTFKNVNDAAGGPELYSFDMAGTFSVSNVVVTAAGAVDASGLRWLPIPGIQAGMNIRALLSKIDTATSESAIIDMGALWTPERLPNWTFGIVGQNMGPAITSKSQKDANSTDKVVQKKLPPITFRTGAAWKSTAKNIVVDLDVLVPVDNYPKLSIGGEYWYKKLICFRGGYKFQGKFDLNEYNTGGLEGLSVGAGFRYNIVGIDYAFATLGFLGATHRLSLTVNF
jgi:hypothetical protein